MNLLPYVHPVIGTVAILAAAYAATLGFEGRRRPRRGTLLAHRRLGPWVFGLMAASWIGGLVTVVLARADLDAAASTHFRLGTGITLLMAGSAVSARRIESETVRRIHPVFGAAALVLCGFQVFLGFGLLP